VDSSPTIKVRKDTATNRWKIEGTNTVIAAKHVRDTKTGKTVGKTATSAVNRTPVAVVKKKIHRSSAKSDDSDTDKPKADKGIDIDPGNGKSETVETPATTPVVAVTGDSDMVKIVTRAGITMVALFALWVVWQALSDSRDSDNGTVNNQQAVRQPVPVNPAVVQQTGTWYSSPRETGKRWVRRSKPTNTGQKCTGHAGQFIQIGSTLYKCY